jgi:hypothetical protein
MANQKKPNSSRCPTIIRFMLLLLLIAQILPVVDGGNSGKSKWRFWKSKTKAEAKKEPEAKAISETSIWRHRKLNYKRLNKKYWE